MSRKVECEFCGLPLTLWQAQIHDCLRLDHFDKEEWFDFARRLKPGLTDDEYEQMWGRFCTAKAEHARHS